MRALILLLTGLPLMAQLGISPSPATLPTATAYEAYGPGGNGVTFTGTNGTSICMGSVILQMEV